jgi:hypothetical protein
MESDSAQELNVILEEYKTLRQESLNAINNRVVIFGWSFTALTIITSAAVVSTLPIVVICLILGFAVPLLAKFIIYVWLGEYERSQRAGAFIRVLETRINKQIGQTALTWENHLRGRGERSDRRISQPYLFAVSALELLGYISELLAMYYAWQSLIRTDGWVMIPVFGVLILITEILSWFAITEQWRRARNYNFADTAANSTSS